MAEWQIFRESQPREQDTGVYGKESVYIWISKTDKKKSIAVRQSTSFDIRPWSYCIIKAAATITNCRPQGWKGEIEGISCHFSRAIWTLMHPAKSWQRQRAERDFFAKEEGQWSGRMIFYAIKNRNEHNSFRCGFALQKRYPMKMRTSDPEKIRFYI